MDASYVVPMEVGRREKDSINSMSFAPIALIAYNRVDHLRSTVEALLANDLSEKSDLHIFCDGPKNASHLEDVKRVRKFVRTIQGFGSVHIVERNENFGLARSITSSTTELCRQYGKTIVIEDDLIMAPCFLSYMNEALERYQQNPAVMAISAYMYPVDRPDLLPEMFFCRIPTCWGWATWERAWADFQPNSAILVDGIRQRQYQRSFDLEGSYPYFDTLLAHARGELDVWGVLWYASVFLRDGLCLYPAHSLVQNTGMDGSGIHCGPSTSFDVDLTEARLGAFPEKVEEHRPAVDQIIDFFGSLHRPLWERVFHKIRRLIIK